MATLTTRIEKTTVGNRLEANLPLVVIQFNSWTEMERYRAEWDRLLAASPSSSIFRTPEWLAIWWRAYGDGRQLCSLAFVDAQRRTLAIAPLYLESSSR